MLRFMLLVASFLLLADVAFAQEDPDRAITITLIDETGLNAQKPVVVTLFMEPGSVGHDLPREELSAGRWGWKATMPFPMTEWVAEPTFLVKVPMRVKEGALTVDIPASESTLSFRVRAMYDPREYEVPVLLIPGTGERELRDIEAMGPRQRLSQVLLLGQISAFWLKTRPTGDRAKRTVGDLFDIVFNSMNAQTVEEHAPLRLDGEMSNRIRTAFARENKANLDKRFFDNILRNETDFWLEKDRMLTVVMLDNRRCDMAQLLLDYVEKGHAAKPMGAQLHRVPDPNVQIANLKTAITDACPVAETHSGGEL